MGRLYVPKPPKKRSDCLSKGKILALAVIASKKFVPAASRRISRMAPRDSKDSTDTNGNVHPAGKSKGKQNISRISSTDSFGDLTQEAVDKGIAAMRDISRILSFAQTYHDDIGLIESIHGLNIRQKERIEELVTVVDELTFRKAREMERLQDENEAYRATAEQLGREREALEREQATIEDKRREMKSDMERQKEKGINDAKQEFADKFKTRAKQLKEDLEKKIKALERDKVGLNEAIKELEENNTKAQNDLKQQKDSFELDKRSCQSHIVQLESKLSYINATSIVSPQKAEFYIDSFHRLWERIQDVAVNTSQYLPEDTKSLDSDEVRNQLFTASTIFQYHPLSSESAVSTFLRGCAIQDFLSTKAISMIQRQYFVEPTAAVKHGSRTQTMDSILDTISNVPAANSSQELSWRLTTIDKLDHLRSYSPSATATISTEPNQGNIVKEMRDKLLHFQSPSDQQLDAKLSEIASTTIKLWGALRKDSCQVNFDYDPSTGDGQGWVFVENDVTSSFKAATSPSVVPVAQLPSKPVVLFPRITGSFGSDGTSPRILLMGSALSHDSPAFREGLQEIERAESATKEFKRSLRRGSSAQSSPVIGKLQATWPAPHRGFT